MSHSSILLDFFSSAIKSNKYVHYAMLTGILPLAKECALSGLNNLREFNLGNSSFARFYGFSQSDVVALFNLFDINHDYLEDVKKLYSGYKFNTVDSVYNPRSVANCIQQLVNNKALKRESLGKKELDYCALQPYWTMSGYIRYITPLMTQQLKKYSKIDQNPWENSSVEFEKSFAAFINELPVFDCSQQRNVQEPGQFIHGNEDIIHCLLAVIIADINSIKLDTMASEPCVNERKRCYIFLTYEDIPIIFELKF